jgi:hypothetical protein
MEHAAESHPATMAWLIAGAAEYAVRPELSFPSWQAFAYFGIGTPMAALVFGCMAYLTTRGLAKIIARFPLSSDPEVEAERLVWVGVLLAVMLFALFFLVGSCVAVRCLPAWGN